MASIVACFRLVSLRLYGGSYYTVIGYIYIYGVMRLYGGNYYTIMGYVWDYVGIMEKKMETSILIHAECPYPESVRS